MKILFFKLILFILCIHFILNHIITKKNKQYILKLIMKNDDAYNNIKKKMKIEKHIKIKYYKKKRTIHCWIYNYKTFDYINNLLECNKKTYLQKLNTFIKNKSFLSNSKYRILHIE